MFGHSLAGLAPRALSVAFVAARHPFRPPAKFFALAKDRVRHVISTAPMAAALRGGLSGVNAVSAIEDATVMLPRPAA